MGAISYSALFDTKNAISKRTSEFKLNTEWTLTAKNKLEEGLEHDHVTVNTNNILLYIELDNRTFIQEPTKTIIHILKDR